MLPQVASQALAGPFRGQPADVSVMLSASGLLVRQLVPFSLKKLMSPARFRTKKAKRHFLKGHQKMHFSTRVSQYYFFFPFCCCSVPDRYLQSSLEGPHSGGQPGVNLSYSGSCLSDLGLPAWSQPAAFAIRAAENYQAQELVMSPKRQFRGMHFSPSLAIASWTGYGFL